MRVAEFRLERYFAKHEFNAPYLMCCSDCEALTVEELLAMDPEGESRLRRLHLGYTETQGHSKLRDEIAKLYYQIDPAQVLVHAGAEDAIFNVMNCVLEPGDHVIVQSPTYPSLFEVARSIGAQVTKWQADEENDWKLDFGFLEKNVQSNTKALIINCPNNPTGYLMSRNELCAIGEFARERNLTIVSDEVYAFLEYDKNDRLPAACDLDERAVSIGAMSKSFGLPGLRIAWAATRNRALFERLAAFKDYTTICNSAPSELLATIALRNKEKLLARNMRIIKRNLSELGGFFSAHTADFNWRAPKAGPVAFPSLRGPENAQQFSDRLLNARGVLLLPGTIYDESYTHNFRIGFGRKNITECLEKLREVI
jgi:aspartate/methionine/tyrosine aminotransferase